MIEDSLVMRAKRLWCRRPLAKAAFIGWPLVLAAACGGGDDDWGPLAVIDEPSDEAEDALGGNGVLTITEECVILDGDTTLVWRDSQTTWDAERGRILFTQSGIELPLSDGVHIAVGGVDTTRDRSDWIAEPDDSCPPALWNVHTVQSTFPPD
jgi:hypothetical protein